MKTKPRRFRTEICGCVCRVLILAAVLGISTGVRGDGGFVVPRFVWDKHKDINEPTQKAIIAYDSGYEALILQVKYEGPVEEFGWLIPVPTPPTITEGSMGCFYELSQYTQKHLQTRWTSLRMSANDPTRRQRIESAPPEPPVKVVEIKTVGAYQIAILSTKDAGALQNWLAANNFYLPPDKHGVIDSYVKRSWYFVAVRINLGKGDGWEVVSGTNKMAVSSIASLKEKLSSGELRPLHLGFMSDKCVFPLKISSINGKPSEVQIYLLSKEPLLEKTMFERKLPGIYSNDVAAAQRRADSFQRMRLFATRLSTGVTNIPLSSADKSQVQKIRKTIIPSGILPHYLNVSAKELPDCSKEIPSLAENSWWLKKYTWTFKPEEMQDLDFEPAIPVLTEELGSQYGYYAAACLGQFGAEAVWPMMDALRGTNATARTAILLAFDSGHCEAVSEQATFRRVARELINDPDPEVRAFAVMQGTDDPVFLLKAIHDQDFKVAGLAGEVLMQERKYTPEGRKYVPQILELIKDKNPATRVAAIEALRSVRDLKIPRRDMLPFLRVPNLHVVADVVNRLEEEGEDVSNEDATPLLQSTDAAVRQYGLKIICDNAEKSSVEMALPLLKDSEPQVGARATAVLRALTGQHFRQADQWEKWWIENKAAFVVDPKEVAQRREDEWRQRQEAARRDSTPE